MARRRMIDPNIWSSDDVSKLNFMQRLLLIGMFSNADDYGKGRANPVWLRSNIFPYDDIPISDIKDALNIIEKHIKIIIYEIDDSSYYKFTNWKNWQTVQKPQDSQIPEPVKNDSGLILDSVENESGLREEKRREEKIEENRIEDKREEKEKENQDAIPESPLQDAVSADKPPYVQVLEYFSQKSGVLTPNLKAKDTQIALKLTKDIPVNFIKFGIDAAFGKYKPKHSKDQIRSMGYCEPIIFDLWAIEEEKQKGGGRGGSSGKDSRESPAEHYDFSGYGG